MQEEQILLLKEYMKLNKHPSFKKISEDTGIQTTRVFRLFNGSKMKLCEYQIFKNKIESLKMSGPSLEKLAYECSLKLSASACEEVTKILIRKLEMWKLTQTQLPTNTTINKVLA